MPEQRRCIVAGCTPWAREVFEATIAKLPGTWSFASGREELSRERVEAFDPRFIFFLHWRWTAPAWMHERYECVGFHMTDLPYGRGGSPLQNLIVRGHASTKLTAFRMNGEMDAGPVYARRDLALDGPAHAIYRRAAAISAEMIREILDRSPRPQPQAGEPVVFERRRPQESRLPPGLPPRRLYDFIRMLDAPGYPPAFLECDGYRLEFNSAELCGDLVKAEVRIRRAGEGPAP